MTSTNYAIRDAAGRLHAVHVRRETPGGKAMSWRGPDGRSGLNGRRVDTLPLYGSENVAGWSPQTWIVVCEGESDTDALAALGVPALGTVTGATVGTDSVTAPTMDAMRAVATGRRFVTWPDNDDVGSGGQVGGKLPPTSSATDDDARGTGATARVRPSVLRRALACSAAVAPSGPCSHILRIGAALCL